MFYLGRIDVRAPDGGGDRMITDELAIITDTTLHSEAVRCGNALSQKGQWLERVGRAFSDANR